jgi:hypothetical protein
LLLFRTGVANSAAPAERELSTNAPTAISGATYFNT